MTRPTRHPAPTGGTGRLFLALWPDERLRDAFEAWQQAVVTGPRARPTPRRDLHATLVFIGDVDRDRLPAIVAAPDAPGPSSAPALRFEATETWPRGLVVAVADAPPELAAWRDRMADRLTAAGLTLDSRPWRPHVTLARSARAAPPGPSPTRAVDWTPRGHGLAVRDGPHYRVLRSWSWAASHTSAGRDPIPT